jgi:hypothetical protein
MIKLTGRVWDFYDDEDREVDEGDVWLQSKLDGAGRASAAGRHSNLGYSGYYTGFIQAESGRRRFLSWRTMFPGKENGFRKQADKHLAVFRIEECLKSIAGIQVVKEKGGWKFLDESIAEDRIKAHWKSWNTSPPGMTYEEACRIANQMNNNPKTTSLHRYTPEEILSRPESDMQKWMRLRRTAE